MLLSRLFLQSVQGFFRTGASGPAGTYCTPDTQKKQARQRLFPARVTRCNKGTALPVKVLNNIEFFGILRGKLNRKENYMSSVNKKAGSAILIICIVLLVAGLAGVIVAAKMGEGETLWNWTKQTWETIALSCLNAGWIGALIVYWTGRRGRR